MQQLAGIKEIKVKNPTQLNINDLKIGDKLLIKHTDPFVAFVFRVGQVWEIANIDENHEHYRLVNTNTQTSLGFSKRDLSEMIENGVFEYAKKTNVDEIKVKNPIVLFLTEEIIDLDKDFFRYFEGLWDDEKYELINDYEENLKEILNLPDVSDLMMSYDNMREYLKTQTPETLNKIKEYLKNKLKELGVKINEMKINAPIFTLPEGWKELNKSRFLDFLSPEIGEGVEVINGWVPENPNAYDLVLLVKKDNQYYIDGDKDGDNILEGPFPTKEIAERKIINVMNYIMDYWHVLQEMKVKDPTTPPIEEFGDENIDEIKKLVGYDGTKVLKTFEKTKGDKAAYAVFNVIINGTNYKTIIIISYDPNFIPAHLVKTTKINNKTIYYVEV
jgi:hypothetical protein